MTCEQARLLIHGYVDGELDAAHALEIEHHLNGCAACSLEHQRLLALRSAIRGPALGSAALSYTAPAALHTRVRASIRTASMPAPRTSGWRWVGAAAGLAGLAVVMLVGLSVLRGLPTSSVDERVLTEVQASHVRSLMASHLTDVTSTDQHTVKPWFDGKLDFAPPVNDLASQGFPLVGGRLDYVDDRPVAALVYQRGHHFINLFVWPAAQPSGDSQPVTRQGYHLVHWTQSSMTYWVISDLSADELQAFVRLIQHP